MFCNEPLSRKSSVYSIIVIFNGCITKPEQFRKFGENYGSAPSFQRLQLVKRILHSHSYELKSSPFLWSPRGQLRFGIQSFFEYYKVSAVHMPFIKTFPEVSATAPPTPPQSYALVFPQWIYENTNDLTSITVKCVSGFFSVF